MSAFIVGFLAALFLYMASYLVPYMIAKGWNNGKESVYRQRKR